MTNARPPLCKYDFNSSNSAVVKGSEGPPKTSKSASASRSRDISSLFDESLKFDFNRRNNFLNPLLGWCDSFLVALNRMLFFDLSLSVMIVTLSCRDVYFKTGLLMTTSDSLLVDPSYVGVYYSAIKYTGH